MKYMGSKRSMLQNGLDEVLHNEIQSAKRFVDLFSGTGAVSIHVAEKYAVTVLANDLQSYSSVLSAAVIKRISSVNDNDVLNDWLNTSVALCNHYDIPIIEEVNYDTVYEQRRWCEKMIDLPVTKAYGGHYYSSEQAVIIDILRANVPEEEPYKTMAIAALIHAASKSAASPGHTAQPFQPTQTARRYIKEAWKKDIVKSTKESYAWLANKYAKKIGEVVISDANNLANDLQKDDLVFLDPPYSGVHYSRFYHVLETVATGVCGDVSGVGRYPEIIYRPVSQYSIKTRSVNSLNELIKKISERKAKAIMTFPNHICSNGLSGDIVKEIASVYYKIKVEKVKSRFSSLGGVGNGACNAAGRSARKDAEELIIIMNQM